MLHVIDTKSLETLNRLGMAWPAQERAQKKRLGHHARLNARRLLESDDAKGVDIRRILAEGSPFAEIAWLARLEKVDLVVMGSYSRQIGGVDKIFSAAQWKKSSDRGLSRADGAAACETPRATGVYCISADKIKRRIV